MLQHLLPFSDKRLALALLPSTPHLPFQELHLLHFHHFSSSSLSLSVRPPPSPSQQEEGSTDAFSELTFCASVKTLHSKAGWLSVRARSWQ